MENTGRINGAKELAAQSWFGYGRWDAHYWFIGMEPGGDDGHAGYEAWERLGATELIDCRDHHLWKRDVLGIEDKNWTQWHEERSGTKTQPTWRRLIQTLLAFQEKPTDLQSVYDYQKYKFGRINGETAVLELGALHAPGLASSVDRESFRDERITILRERLIENQPVFALCYGLRFKEQFERVVGAPFDMNGLSWCGRTLCVLAPGPTSRPPSPGSRPEWWIDKGREMKTLVNRHEL